MTCELDGNRTNVPGIWVPFDLNRLGEFIDVEPGTTYPNATAPTGQVVHGSEYWDRWSGNAAVNESFVDHWPLQCCTPEALCWNLNVGPTAFFTATSETVSTLRGWCPRERCDEGDQAFCPAAVPSNSLNSLTALTNEFYRDDVRDTVGSSIGTMCGTQ